MIHQDAPVSRFKAPVVVRQVSNSIQSNNTGVLESYSRSRTTLGAESDKKDYRRFLPLPEIRESSIANELSLPATVQVAVDSNLENHPESKSFMATALAWQGSVTPRVLPRVAFTAAYATAVYVASTFVPAFTLPMTPFEYSGGRACPDFGASRQRRARSLVGGSQNMG